MREGHPNVRGERLGRHGRVVRRVPGPGRLLTVALALLGLLVLPRAADAQSPEALRAGAVSLSRFLERTNATRGATSLGLILKDVDDDASIFVMYLQRGNTDALAVLGEDPELANALRELGLDLPPVLPSPAESTGALDRMCDPSGTVSELGQALTSASLLGAKHTFCSGCPAVTRELYTRVARALEDAGVDYVIAGGVAINANDIARVTEDLDVAIAVTPENLQRVVAALRPFGFQPRAPVPFEQLGDMANVESWIRDKNLAAFTLMDWSTAPPAEIDIMLNPALPYERIRAGMIRPFGENGPRVADLPTIIEMKKAAGREKDLADIPRLEAALRGAPTTTGSSLPSVQRSSRTP